MINYDDYSIYELRLIARQKGIKSPTTKKKQQLIEALNSNASTTKTRKPQKGRPCLSLHNKYMCENNENMKYK